MEESEEYESETDEVAEPVAERIRITGAEPAGEIMGLDEPQWATALPKDEEGRSQSPVLGADVGPGEESTAQTPAVDAGAADAVEASTSVPAAPDLPHWTEPPTGQVPAVLDRHSEDDSTWLGGDAGPAWREHQHEWDEDSFDPALLADDETRVGALDDAAPPEHLQWEFKDLEEDTAAAEAERSAGSGGARTTAGGDLESIADEEIDDRPPEPAMAGSAAVAIERAEPGAGPGANPADDLGRQDKARPGAVRVPTGTASTPISVTSSELPIGRTTAAASGAGGALAARRRDRSAAKERQSANGRGTGRGGRAKPGGGRNVPVAVATGLGVAVVALVCFKLGTVATVTFAAVVATLATAECFAALRRAGMRPATLLGLVASAALMVAAYAKGVAAFPLVIALVVAATMIWYLVGAERGSPLRGISSTLLAFTWVGVLGAFAGLLLAPSQYPDRHGIAFLLGAIIAVVGEDVGALVVGSWLGRRPLAPRISPNKTWEGFFGGLVFAVVLSVAITGQVSPWTPAKAAVLGVVAAVIGPIGDLCESLVKRDLDLKDMGSMLPGHGGVLDRVDALLFVLPATYYLVRVLHLG